ncbi:MAG: 16S rRNA (guanine(966)-N(2))-methyltransferase RsmD [Caldicoprobacterales bacterium]|nr:16S rRNA (guanine(966)-N(2))-methyltransferase RsmD [Clostridiales bacterium]
MRIIAGRSKGRILESIKGRNTRPTSDKVKEALFNIIQGRIPESIVLDIFAGTGNLGLESLSRGANRAIFIDNDIKAVKTIKRNCYNLGYEKQSEIYRNDAARGLTELSKRDILFDIIFMDPPYGRGYEEPLLQLIYDLNILHNDGIIVIEHDSKTVLPIRIAGLYCYDSRKYGGTGVSFYRKE